MRLAAVAEPGVDAGQVHGHRFPVVYHARRPGRWSGKPVRIRCGPATVTGEATAWRRSRRRSLSSQDGSGRRGKVGPEARRPPSDRQAEALVERGGSQHEAQPLYRPRCRNSRARRSTGARRTSQCDRARRRRERHPRRVRPRRDDRRPRQQGRARLLRHERRRCPGPRDRRRLGRGLLRRPRALRPDDQGRDARRRRLLVGLGQPQGRGRGGVLDRAPRGRRGPLLRRPLHLRR